MSTAASILDSQIIHVKRGRFHNYGFEPCSNAFFDFYVSPKYIEPALLQLEDVGFFLFLRKNINDTNPRWKMPSVRQMMRRLGVGQRKLEAMMARLDGAHLLKKESGFRRGKDQANITNSYLLSDPIQTLDEFLTVAAEDLFPRALKPEWVPCTRNEYRGVRELDTAPVCETDTYKQTLNTKQTGDTEEITLWDRVLSVLKLQTAPATFNSFVVDTNLKSIVDGMATVATSKPFAIDWLENRMKNNIRKTLNLELRLMGETTTVKDVQVVIEMD
jgi:hypothetical protein